MGQEIYLLSDSINIAPQQSDSDNKTPRTFTGIANSGKPFIYHGQRAVVDLSDITYQAKVPVLHLHDREKRVGSGELKTENNQLVISGTLLANDYGEQIANDADGGFPWQMSAHVQAGITEELTGDATAVVNGQTIQAPILILRQCTIPEVSFTPTGVDNATSAVVLSADKITPSAPKGENEMNLEQALAKIKQLEQEISALKTDKEKLEKSAKTAEVEAQLSQKGFTKDDKGKWQGISDNTVNMLLSASPDDAKAMIDDLAQAKQPSAQVPEYLLSEQYPNNGQAQTPVNPLIANAEQRGNGQGSI